MRLFFRATAICITGIAFVVVCVYYIKMQTISFLRRYSATESQNGRLGDLENFEFVMSNDACKDDDVFILFSVTSDPNKRAFRDILRMALRKKVQGRLLRVIFNMGIVQDPQMMERIFQENLIHRDIIMGNFIDSYQNITYGHLQGMEWTIRHCTKAEYFVKMDEDVYVDVYKLVSKLVDDNAHFHNRIFCKLLVGTTPFRDPESKYYISFEEYPRKEYPTYCNGWLVVYPTEVLRSILQVATKVPLIWISDVFVTGLVIEKIPTVGFVNMEPEYTVDTEYLISWLYSPLKSANVFAGPVDTDLVLLAALHYKTDSVHRH